MVVHLAAWKAASLEQKKAVQKACQMVVPMAGSWAQKMADQSGQYLAEQMVVKMAQCLADSLVAMKVYCLADTMEPP